MIKDKLQVLGCFNIFVCPQTAFGVAHTCVVVMSECPSIRLIVSIGTPASSVISEANECLA